MPLFLGFPRHPVEFASAGGLWSALLHLEPGWFFAQNSDQYHLILNHQWE
jgi:hypothetical protein